MTANDAPAERMRAEWLGNRPYLTCPVDDCAWRLSMAEVELRTTTAFTIDARTSEIVDRKQAETIEDIIREHAQSHDVLDYLRTIQRLRMDLAQQDSGIRPHTRITEVAHLRPADPDPELTGTMRQFWGEANDE